jgi:F0F1-type ATP synthase assembly protein I
MPFHRAIPESKPPAKAASGLSSYVEAEKLMQIAFVMPSALLICWGAGWLAARLLHQSWMTIAGVVFGCVVGLFYVIQTAMAAEKSSRSQTETGADPQDGSGNSPGARS